jgi:hypothetical protein
MCKIEILYYGISSSQKCENILIHMDRKGILAILYRPNSCLAKEISFVVHGMLFISIFLENKWCTLINIIEVHHLTNFETHPLRMTTKN